MHGKRVNHCFSRNTACGYSTRKRYHHVHTPAVNSAASTMPAPCSCVQPIICTALPVLSIVQGWHHAGLSVLYTVCASRATCDGVRISGRVLRARRMRHNDDFAGVEQGRSANNATGCANAIPGGLLISAGLVINECQCELNLILCNTCTSLLADIPTAQPVCRRVCALWSTSSLH